AASEQLALGVKPATLGAAIVRAAAFRDRFGIAVPDDPFDDGPSRALAAEIAAASITHVGPALPAFGGPIRVVMFVPQRRSPVEELASLETQLEGALRERLGSRLAFSLDGSAPAGDGPLIVCSSSASFDPPQAER